MTASSSSPSPASSFPLRIRHRISFAHRRDHLLEIESTCESEGTPLPTPLVVWMPVWTPGSYLVREYARHVERFEALADGTQAAAGKVRKNAWRIDHAGARTIVFRYRVYANELTVRTNHVDETHAYFNGAATFMTTDRALLSPVFVEIDAPREWQIVTSLPPLSPASRSDRPTQFVARDFDELCDSPFECGALITRSFEWYGRHHRMAAPDDEDTRAIDWAKLEADTRTIVATEAALVAGVDGEAAARALPYDDYLFLWHVSPRGRGGLEHRKSATLLAKPSSFTNRSGYLDVLSLVAHEFFHLWNVKRIRPAGLSPYRYEEENYTRLLWWFEGATSYYDWRVLRLANLATAAEYLGHLAETIARLEDTPGALVHSLEEASFDAWIKLYRPDENTVNSTVSYYLKGEIACALLDIELRHRSGGRATLDHVVRRLWNDYGANEIPVPEDRLLPLLSEVCGASLDDCFTRLIRRAAPIDFDAALAPLGLSFARSRGHDAPRASLGLRLSVQQGRAIVEAVLRGRAAARAGLDPQDEIIAVDGRRVVDGRLEPVLAGVEPGARVPIVICRDQRLRTFDIELDSNPGDGAAIVARPDATPAQRALCEAWLAAPFSAVPVATNTSGRPPTSG